MSMQSKFSKPSTWLPSWLSSWCSILLVATVSSACGGSGGSGDQGRDPILGLPSATLVALNVSPTSSSIQIGAMQQYVATASFADGSARVVTSESSWTSSAASNASVSNLGAAQGIAAGSVVITAKYADKTATANLVVLPATLLSIAVTPANPSIPVGTQQLFKAIGTYSDGSSSDISAISTFSVSNSSVASIAANGNATGLLVGVTPIVASSGGLSGNTNLNVSPAVLLQLAISPLNPSLQIGATQALAVTATYTDGSSVVVTNSSTFSSATTAIASVVSNSGIVTAISAGNSVISANFNGMTVSTNVTVTPAMLVSIAVTPPNASVFIGATQTFIATGTYSDGSTANISNSVVWTSGDVSKATILMGGVATGVSAGLTTISASFNGKIVSTDLTVKPALVITSITIKAVNPSAAVGATQQFVATANYNDLSTANITNTVVWSSGSPLVATISNSAPRGLASALAIGVTAITATQGLLSGTTNLTVTAALVAGINLGVADSFAVLAGNSITNNSGGLTLVSGDVGSPSQTVDPVQTAGFTNYKSGAILSNALAAVQVAIADANSRPCDVNSGAGINLGGMTLAPGVYCYAGSITITGTFTMNGPGLYIFRTSSTLDTSANSIVALNGGASASNVFWVPTAPTTLGANSAFIGTVMTTSAAITMGDMATLQNGRVLSASAVTLRNNVITR